MTPQPSEQPRTAAGRRLLGTWPRPKHRHSWLDEFSKECIVCGATKTDAAYERAYERARPTLQEILAIEAAAAAPDPVASPDEAVRLLRLLRAIANSADTDGSDADPDLIDEARRYLAATEEGDAVSERGCVFYVRGEDEKPVDIRLCNRPRDEHPITGRGRFENHRNYLSDDQPSEQARPSLKDCICETNSRWPWMHLTYCPWRKRTEASR